MRSKTGLLAAAAVVLCCGAAQAATLTPIASYTGIAGAITSVLGVNNNGWMTGNITLSDGTSLGFLRNAAGVYTTFSLNTNTFGRGIDNANDVIGYATDAGDGFATDSEFVRAANGTVTTLSNPNTGLPLHGIGQGENDAGVIVGDYLSGANSAPPQIGYLLDGSTFTSIAVPGTERTSARAIEDDGTLAGWAINSGGLDEGFILEGGVYSTFQDPNATAGNQGTIFEDINNNGIVSGMWMDSNSDDHAFEFNTHTNTFYEISVAGASDVEAFGINDHDQVVLTTNITDGPNNFLYQASVPEPATWAMMLVGFLGLGSSLRRRRAALAV